MAALSFTLTPLSIKEQVYGSYPEAWDLHVVGHEVGDDVMLLSWCSESPDRTVVAAYHLQSDRIEEMITFPGVFHIAHAAVAEEKIAFVARMEEAHIEDEDDKSFLPEYQVFFVDLSSEECWPLTDPSDTLIHVHFVYDALMVLNHRKWIQYSKVESQIDADEEAHTVCQDFCWAQWVLPQRTLFYVEPEGRRLVAVLFHADGSCTTMLTFHLPEQEIWMKPDPEDQRSRNYVTSTTKISDSGVNFEVIVGQEGLLYVCFQHFGGPSVPPKPPPIPHPTNPLDLIMPPPPGGAGKRQGSPKPPVSPITPIKKLDVQNIWRLGRASSFRNNPNSLQLLETTQPRMRREGGCPFLPRSGATDQDDPYGGLYSVAILFLHQGCRIVAKSTFAPSTLLDGILQFFTVEDYLVVWLPHRFTHLLDVGAWHTPGHHITCSDVTTYINEASFSQYIYLNKQAKVQSGLSTTERSWLSLDLSERCSVGHLDRDFLATLLSSSSVSFGTKLNVLHCLSLHTEASYQATLGVLNNLRRNPFGLEAVYIIKEFIVGSVMRQLVKEMGLHPCLLNLPLSFNKDNLAGTKVHFVHRPVRVDRSAKLSVHSQDSEPLARSFWSGRLLTPGSHLRAVYSWMSDLQPKSQSLGLGRLEFTEIKLKWPYYVSKKKELMENLEEARKRCPVVTNLMAIWEGDESTRQRDQLQVFSVFREIKTYLHRCCPEESEETIQNIVFAYLKALIRECHQLYYNLCVFFSLPAAFQWHHIEKRHSLRELYSLLEAYLLVLESFLCPLPRSFSNSLFLLAFKTLDYGTFVNRIHQGIIKVTPEAFQQIKDVGPSQKYKRKKLGLLSLMDKEQVKNLLANPSQRASSSSAGRPMSIWGLPTALGGETLPKDSQEEARRLSMHIGADELSYFVQS